MNNMMIIIMTILMSCTINIDSINNTSNTSSSFVNSSSSKENWCERKTIAQLKALQNSSPNFYECATVIGKLVYRKSTVCRAGAFYVEDSTGSMFVCDPSVKTTELDSGSVVCPESVLAMNPGKTDGFESSIQVEGYYYPSKPICGDTVCWCQNGLEVNFLKI